MRATPAIELKDDPAGDDPAQIVTKALEGFQAKIDDRLKALETKTANDNKLGDRLDKIEAKVNRVPLDKKSGENDDIERKAFESFVRRGKEAMGADEIKSLVVANDVGAGYLAPPQFSAEMIRNLVLFSPVRAAASVGATGSPSVILPKRTSITNATWEGEIEASSESEPAFGQIEIPNFGMKTFTDISVQLLEDSAQSVDGELSIAFGQDFGQKEGAAFLNGTGVKQPRGIMVCPDINTFPNGDNETVKSDALIDMQYSLAPFYRANAAWMMNGTTIAAIRKLKNSIGDYLWQEALSAGQPPTLLGRPVIEAIDMPDIDANSFPILFGNFNLGYRIYDRVALAVLRDPFTQATNSLVRFHARRRVGGDVLRPGAFIKLKMA
jgi:HK97 family phage major capsid protein